MAQRTTIRLAAVGDIFPGDHYFSLGHGMMSRTRQASLASLFAGVAPLLKSADVAIANLECPLSDRSNRTTPVGRGSFRGLPQFCALLKSAGFTHINIANNHMLQHGIEAFEDTVRGLREAGLAPVGLASQRTGSISEAVTLRIGDQSVGIVGYSCVAVKGEQDPPYAYCDSASRIAAEIAELSRQFDHLFVSCHAGDEGLGLPSAAQIAMYESFIRAGARAVLGHHPHVLQPVVTKDRTLIAYSLGNFAFDSFWNREFTTGAVLLIEASSAALASTLHPTEFLEDFTVSPLPERGAADILARLQSQARVMHTVSEKDYLAQLNACENGEQRRKYGYFVANLIRGKPRLKAAFVLAKLLARPL